MLMLVCKSRWFWNCGWWLRCCVTQPPSSPRKKWKKMVASNGLSAFLTRWRLLWFAKFWHQWPWERVGAIVIYWERPLWPKQRPMVSRNDHLLPRRGQHPNKLVLWPYGKSRLPKWLFRCARPTTGALSCCWWCALTGNSDLQSLQTASQDVLVRASNFALACCRWCALISNGDLQRYEQLWKRTFYHLHGNYLDNHPLFLGTPSGV